MADDFKGPILTEFYIRIDQIMEFSFSRWQNKAQKLMHTFKDLYHQNF